MVDVGHPARDGVIRNLLGWPEAAYAATIDLDVVDPAEVDEMLGHMTVVGRLAAGRSHRLHAVTKFAIRAISGATERLLKKSDAVALHRVEPQRCCLDVLAEHLPGIDQQDTIGSETLARGVEMGDVALEGFGERRPAALG